MAKVLMKGNEALAAAAIKGGCRYYFGYPITPQNEFTEFMSKKMPESGGAFIQAESELAAINMVYGAACAGARALTSSSSPGIALMQEGISFLCSADLPCVIVNISRGGPGVGGIQPGQADYYQATRGGGNGDYHVIVYAPASIQEGIDLTADAFNIADKYRNPVMILADGMLGQMMEPVELPNEAAIIETPKDWALTGARGRRKANTIKSLYLVADQLEARNIEQKNKYDRIIKNEVRYESYNTEEAEIILVAFGTTARIVKESIELLKEKGIK
ncbi:MAG TPA: 3-methyl-2-oxobutanoate dehydrogenase subunit VorB, partial [Anaerovoracaceae bacterium]|nr:3-methyl-2-oxobutanoate dehydrogenase subunit VorB [Anaerovoracaceae bacterium]